MQVPQQVKDRALQIVTTCVAKAEAHFKRTYEPIQIYFDCRGRRGGFARGSREVHFNPVLLMENLDEYYNQVIPHEVAHCIDSANGRDTITQSAWYVMSGVRKKREVHGDNWKRIMRLFGCKPDRCHQMDTANAAVRIKAKFEYKCKNCDKSYFVSSVLHNRMRAGSQRYCTKCGVPRGEIRYVGGLGQVSYAQARKLSEQRAENVAASQAVVQTALKSVPVDKMAVAKDIMAMTQYGYNMTRQQFIQLAVARGLKATTASTYFNQLKTKS